MRNSKYIRSLVKILISSGLINKKEGDRFLSRYSFEIIYADGSLRNFFRVKREGTSICIGVYPHAATKQELAEARSAWMIGNHLFQKDIPVPEIYGVDEASGLIVFEDCGDDRIYDLLVRERDKKNTAGDKAISLYRHVIEVLVHMQIKGAESFKKNWCYDTAKYNREVMIKKEAQYFLKSFWYDLLDGEMCNGVDEEFEEIAIQAGTGLNDFFLHRDFQCRNIMISNGEIRIIDFQAGRLGPPGYDLASLLIDPYSNLTEGTRHELFNWYLKILGSSIDFDEKKYYRQYLYLSLLRNLQILGAFSFLYQKRNKPFFKEFIEPSLQTLRKTLSETEMKSYTILSSIAEKAQKYIERVI